MSMASFSLSSLISVSIFDLTAFKLLIYLLIASSLLFWISLVHLSYSSSFLCSFICSLSLSFPYLCTTRRFSSLLIFELYFS